MRISHQDIQQLARLARIGIDEAIAEDTAAKISDILTMVEQMQASDTSGIEPMANPLDAVQRLRPDRVDEENQRSAFQAIAPATEDGYYLVPRVID